MARTLSAERLRPLVQTLADGRWHSGAALAKDSHVTRAALSKRLQHLARWGLPVETRTGQGCRLAQPLELLDPDLIRGHLPPALRGRIPVTVVLVTDSTNRQLMDVRAAADPQALLAEHQTAGRGRRGRRWHSPFGANLYLSLSWTFREWPPALGALPLAAGVACADALSSLGLADLRLKWPNDLLVRGRKLGGILVEQRGEPGGSCRAVIGVGLNVAMREAAGIDQPWVSLDEALAPGRVSRNALAAAVLECLAAALERFAAEGFVPFLARWRGLDATYRRAVVVESGGSPVSGTAMGVDETGALRVRTARREERILSGDVSLRTKPDP